MPSVHWAQNQYVLSMRGTTRRLYDFEFMYVIAGEMRVHFSNEPDPTTYNAGDLLFLQSADYHRIEITSAPGAQLLGIHFDFYDELDIGNDLGVIVDEQAVHDDHFCFLPVNGQGEAIFARRYTSIPQEIVRWMDVIKDEFMSARPEFETVCRGLMLLIITALMRHQEKIVRVALPAYDKALHELTEELHQNMHMQWSNSAMAHRLNLSEDHFIRLFKETFGTTPYQYLQRIRHHEAIKYLRESDLKIEYIGALVGYKDLHQFSHVFKKWQGVSPRMYRRMCNIL
ncbi:helix-turn-helix domain-containing protein [Paenibacillus sp. 2TAB23]|uniref:helix-turn-helix domain-containing protein n=1 Tax=Paenibacillus sp. 2TAB23 TaxID=3233004 RepID=UPI003F9C21E1